MEYTVATCHSHEVIVIMLEIINVNDPKIQSIIDRQNQVPPYVFFLLQEAVSY